MHQDRSIKQPPICYTPTMPHTPPRIMVVGDSIAAGAGASDSAGFRSNLAGRFASESLSVAFVGSISGPQGAHEGHAGFTMGQARVGMLGWMTASDPDVVLLLAGTNDNLFGTPAAYTVENLGACIDLIGASRKIVVLPPPPAPAVATNRKVDILAQSYGVVVSEKRNQGYRTFFVPDYPGLDPLVDLADGIHPDDGGYALMAQAIWPVLRWVVLHCP